ncbi:MAG: hypothetical protein ACJZ1P_08000 [Candidatus Neomarinimicrobiota bacterium]
MKIIFFILIFSSIKLFSQADSIIKIFPTDLMRANILTGKPKDKVKKNTAHFRAVYYTSGELKYIEFIPANWDKGRRKRFKSPDKLKLYYEKWNPKTQELLNGITKKEAIGKQHYIATLDEKGLVNNVDYFNKNGKVLWTFIMHWDENGKSSQYDIKFYYERNLFELNKELFAPDLSSIKPGWIARYKFNHAGITQSVHVLDEFENLYYFYKFKSNKKVLQSRYFRSDSTLVGSHSVRFNENKRPIRITYFNQNQIMKNAITYEYQRKAEIVISQLNNKGEIIERRIIKEGKIN